MIARTYHDVCVGYDDLGLFAEQERVEADVIETEVHPALTWHAILRVATRIIYECYTKNT